MPFLQNKDENEKSKRRSMLGFLFNPDIGDSIRPMGESIGMFVKLIALIFASNGLFPRNHPALMSDVPPGVPVPRLTLGGIIRIAYSRLTFTRAGLPKILFFIAVVGTLAFSALFALMFLLSLFIGHAHAASMFTPPDAQKDLAINWINYLFLGKDITAAANAAGQFMPSSMSFHTVFYHVLAFYSNGILVIAGVILLYHLTSMVVETAHHGTPMGKRANQIWAPIRLVIAIGLLVPIGVASAGSPGGGLNTGQYIVVQVAKWGSGLASNAWKKILDGVSDANFTYPPPEVPTGINRVVKDMAKTYACLRAFNAILQRSGFSGSDLVQPYTDPMNNNRVNYTTSLHFIDMHYPIFGYYEVPATPVQPPLQPGVTQGDKAIQDAMFKAVKTVYSENATAFTSAQPDIWNLSNNVTLYLSTAYPDGTADSDGNPTQDPVGNVDDIINNYHATLESSLQGVQSAVQDAVKAINSDWGEQGWVTAGAWFNVIVRAQLAAADAAESSMPLTGPPAEQFVGEGGVVWKIQSLFGEQSVRPAFKTAQVAVRDFEQYVLDTSAAGNGITQKTLALTGQKPPDGNGSMALSALMHTINYVGKSFGLWNDGDGLIFTFNGNVNPLAALAQLGNKYVKLGLELISWGAGGALASNLLHFIPGVGDFLKNLSGGLATLVMALGGIFLVAGMTLAYLIPMLPFIKFFFNVMTWLMSLFEALVAAPLFALAHLTPYGEGLPGDMAKGGYFFLLAIFLRPVLTVIGLFAGMLLFFVAISFLNMTFTIAMLASGSTGGSLAVFSKIFFSLMYVVLAYICVNTCFKAMSFFAEHNIKWMGHAGPEPKEMGDRGAIASVVGALPAYLGEQMLIRGGGQLAGLIAPKASDRTKDIIDAIKGPKAGGGGNARQDASQGRDLGSRGSRAGAPISSGGSGGSGNRNQIPFTPSNPDTSPEGPGAGGGNPGGDNNNAAQIPSDTGGGPGPMDIPPVTNNPATDNDNTGHAQVLAEARAQLASHRAQYGRADDMSVDEGERAARRQREDNLIRATIDKYSGFLRERTSSASTLYALHSSRLLNS